MNGTRRSDNLSHLHCNIDDQRSPSAFTYVQRTSDAVAMSPVRMHSWGGEGWRKGGGEGEQGEER